MCAETFSFYIGFTGQELENECFGFLEFRGAALSTIDGIRVYEEGRRYMPIYTTHDGQRILDKALRDELGLKAFVVFDSPLMENAIEVEELLQRRFSEIYINILNKDRIDLKTLSEDRIDLLNSINFPSWTPTRRTTSTIVADHHDDAQLFTIFKKGAGAG